MLTAFVLQLRVGAIMKILILSPYFFPESFKVNDLVKELELRGHKVTVLTGQPNYPKGKIFEGYSNWSRWADQFGQSKVLRVPVYPRGSGGLLRLAMNYFVFVLSTTVMGLPRLKFKRFDYTLVFASSPITSAIPAIIYKFITGTPVAIWVQDLWPETVLSVGAIKNKLLYGLICHLVKFIYKSSDLLLLQSNSFYPSVLKWGGRPEQIKYFPNWAEDQFTEEVKANPNIKNRPFKILFAGNIGRAQGVETILLAAEKTRSHPEIEWHFYGDGVLSEWLNQEIKRINLSSTVFWHGRKPLEDMPKIYAEHHVFLVTLKKDDALSLVLPSKIQTYLATGKPILASGDGEIASTIYLSKSGLVSPAEDANGLAENAIILSTTREEKMNEFSKNGKNFYQKEFSKANLIPKLEKYLTENLRR